MMKNRTLPIRLFLITSVLLIGWSMVCPAQEALQKAVQYLLTNQNSEGAWSEDRHGMAFHDTTVVLETLEALDLDDRIQYNKGIEYVLRYQPRSNDTLARKILAQANTRFAVAGLAEDLLDRRQGWPYPGDPTFGRL